MKFWQIAAVLGALSVALPAAAQVQVRGYTKRDGTYVAPHVRTSPNSTTTDNWTTRPNVNPYTGTQGTRQPTYTSPYQPATQPRRRPSSPYSSYGSSDDE